MSIFSGQDERRVGRQKDFKPTVSAGDGKKRREAQSQSLRAGKRDDLLLKKRREAAAEAQEGLVISSSEETTSAFGFQVPTSMDPAAGPAKNLEALCQQIHSNDPTAQHSATLQFRKLLSMEQNPPIADVIQAPGVVGRLVEFLKRCENPPLQFEAAWALTNIASGTSDHTRVVINSGAVPLFVQLLESPADDVREQAVWALGNIAGDSARCRDHVLSLNVLQPIIGIMQNDPKITMMRNATWTLSNLCRGKPIPELLVIGPALPTLAQLLYHPDEEVLTDACWAISYMSDGPNDRIDAVLHTGLIRRLIELLTSGSTAVQTPALRTVGNIVTGTDRQTQEVINAGCLPCLHFLLSHPKKTIKKEACWTISNITAGNTEQIQAIIDANLVPPLIKLLSTAEFEVRKEAAWALSNATSGGNQEQIDFLVTEGVVGPLVELLAVPDPKLINVALEGLDNILRSGQQRAGDAENPYCRLVEEAGGLEKLESLQSHTNSDIFERTVQVMEAYFDVTEADDMTENVCAAPATQEANAGGAFSFQAHSGDQSGGYSF